MSFSLLIMLLKQIMYLVSYHDKNVPTQYFERPNNSFIIFYCGNKKDPRNKWFTGYFNRKVLLVYRALWEVKRVAFCLCKEGHREPQGSVFPVFMENINGPSLCFLCLYFTQYPQFLSKNNDFPFIEMRKPRQYWLL